MVHFQRIPLPVRDTGMYHLRSIRNTKFCISDTVGLKWYGKVCQSGICDQPNIVTVPIISPFKENPVATHNGTTKYWPTETFFKIYQQENATFY
jgi:hypothetical protein